MARSFLFFFLVDTLDLLIFNFKEPEANAARDHYSSSRPMWQSELSRKRDKQSNTRDAFLDSLMPDPQLVWSSGDNSAPSMGSTRMVSLKSMQRELVTEKMCFSIKLSGSNPSHLAHANGIHFLFARCFLGGR